MHTRKPRALPLVVYDPWYLAWLLESERDQWRTQVRAAAIVGIDRGHFSRLCRGKAGRTITQATFAGLKRLIPEDRHNELRAAVFSPGTIERFNKYLHWLSYAHAGFGSVGIEVSDGLEMVSHPVDLARTVHESGHRCLGIAELAQSTYWDLVDHPTHGLTLEAFEREMMGRGFSLRVGDTTLPDARLRLALYRIVEPLSAAARSGGVERGTEEMSDEELGAYLLASIIKERILLNRAPDWLRVQDYPV